MRTTEKGADMAARVAQLVIQDAVGCISDERDLEQVLQILETAKHIARCAYLDRGIKR
jgi:hypothetical protein